MKFLKKVLFFLSFILVTFSSTYTEDALDDVLWVNSKASNYQIINQESDVKWLVVSQKWILWSDDKPSLMIRISKLMLKFAVIIWVFVFLIWGIRFLLSFGDDSKAKKVRDNLLIAVLWFVIAFWAWIILQIILSIWPSITWG